MTVKRFIKFFVKAFIPYGLLYLRRRYAPRLLNALRKMFAKWGVKPLNPAAGSSPRFIITLTSYGERVEKSVFYAVCSLLSQSEAPEKIVLYLAHGTEIPRKLEELKRCGLEIRFCDDLKSYKKLVPALLEFPDDVLITADDDIFYPRKWLKALKAAYIENPRAIHCHRAHEIRVYEDGSLRPYSEWNFMSAGFCCNESVFPTTGGGVLYPPHSLDGRCTDEKLFLKLAPKADDVWFWAMANLKGTECAVIKNGFNAASEVVPNDQNGLCVSNVNGGGNDRQLKAVVEAFPELKKVFEKIKSFDSADYWEGRYAQGGNSGAGSRDKLAAFKAGIINSFVAERSIKTVMEFGCGDGGQLLLADYPFYTGFDVSDTALEKCRKLFTAGGGGGKAFFSMNEYNGGKAELVLSLDVIYHLVEDDVYNKYMETVFNAAKRYVIIYSSNSEYVEYFTPCPHIKHRRFTDWALEFAKEWKLMEHIPNKYPYKGNHLKGSFADFYIYEKTGF